MVNLMSAAGIKTSKKPVDPLSNSEYVYSLTSETREYALKADYEGDSVAYARIPHLTSPNLGEGLSFSPPGSGGAGGGTSATNLTSDLTPLTSRVSAATGNPTIAYVRGTYNGVVTKVSTSGIVNLIAIPNILVTPGVTSLTGSSVGFIVNGQTNS